MAYRIELSPDARGHLAQLTAARRATVLDAIERRLSDQPDVNARNRKEMEPNPLARWELRVGTFRVYYDVIGDPEPTVAIKAIARKDRGKIYIGGQEVEL